MKVQRKHRLLAILLTVCMIFSTFVVNSNFASAEGGAPATTTTLEFSDATKVDGSDAVKFTVGENDWEVAISGIACSWGSHDTGNGINPELKDVPKDTSVTFTLSGPSDAPKPKLQFGGETLDFSGDNAITKTFTDAGSVVQISIVAGSPSAPAGVGFWVDNTGCEQPGGVDITYANGSYADIDLGPYEQGNPVYGFAAESRIKVAIDAVNGAGEAINPWDLPFEIELSYGPGASAILDLDDSNVTLDFNDNTKAIVEFNLPADVEIFCVRVFWEGMPGPALNAVRVDYDIIDGDGGLVEDTTNGIIKDCTDPQIDIPSLPYMYPGFYYEYEFRNSDLHALSFKITRPTGVSMDDVSVEVEINGDNHFYYKSSLTSPDAAGNQPLTINADGSFSFAVPSMYEYEQDGTIKKDTDGNDIVIGYPECIVRVSWIPKECGSSEIAVEALKYLYAYTDDYDFNGDGSKNADDLRYALACELYRKFIWIYRYGDLGFSGLTYGGYDTNANKAVIEQLYDRLSITADGTITAKDSLNGDVTINRYKASIDWGIDIDTRQPIHNDLYVYDLSEDGTNFNHILICTDFNKETGTGTQFYIRDIRNDRVEFSDYTTGAYDTDKDNGIVIYADGENAVIGGYDSITDVISWSDNLQSVTQAIYPENMVIAQGYSVHIRFMDPSATYVVVHSEGETMAYDGMGLNGFAPDTICEAGNGATISIFVGDTTVYLSPLVSSISGIEKKVITDVRLKDSTMAAGVSIDKSNLAKVKIEFLSNYYDMVTLEIEYEGGITKELTIERVGLVIRYHFLSDQSSDKMNFDCWGGDHQFEGPSFTYDFSAGEQIMIFATYYHPTNETTLSGQDDLSLVVSYGDGTSEIISKNDQAHHYDGYAPGGQYGAVNTTTFIIDFIPLTQNNAPQNYKGGFNAMVVNGGYNDSDTFGGAQIGSGKGVYWDGNISF